MSSHVLDVLAAALVIAALATVGGVTFWALRRPSPRDLETEVRGQPKSLVRVLGDDELEEAVARAASFERVVRASLDARASRYEFLRAASASGTPPAAAPAAPAPTSSSPAAVFDQDQPDAPPLSA